MAAFEETDDGGVMTDVPRPTGGDVVELIVADHRLFEDLLHVLRDKTKDRAAARATLAGVVVGHAVAEERFVYPALLRQTSLDGHDVAHGNREHLEANERLLDLLAVTDVLSDEFDDAVEALSKALAHHLDEEERDILNPARLEATESTRAEVGAQFAAERARQLDAGCGEPEQLRHLVEGGGTGPT